MELPILDKPRQVYRENKIKQLDRAKKYKNQAFTQTHAHTQEKSHRILTSKLEKNVGLKLLRKN